MAGWLAGRPTELAPPAEAGGVVGQHHSVRAPSRSPVLEITGSSPPAARLGLRVLAVVEIFGFKNGRPGRIHSVDLQHSPQANTGIGRATAQATRRTLSHTVPALEHTGNSISGVR